MEIQLNRACRTHTGHRFEKGDVISEPACVVDILLKLGYADIYTPKAARKTDKNKVTEDNDGR